MAVLAERLKESILDGEEEEEVWNCMQVNYSLLLSAPVF